MTASAGQAELGNVRGSLVVQTLGLSGKNVAAILAFAQ